MPRPPGHAVDAPSGSERSGQATAGGDDSADRPRRQAGPSADRLLEPALFAQMLHHLVTLGCGRPDVAEAAKQALGADYAELEAHKNAGKSGMAALAAESEGERPHFVAAICRKQARSYARRQSEAAEAAQAAARARAAAQTTAGPLIAAAAATAVCSPTAGQNRPLPQGQPMTRPRHRPTADRTCLASRVRGQPAGQLPAGACSREELQQMIDRVPGLPRQKVPMAKILALGLSPERVAEAFKEAKVGLRDPMTLGWNAHKRLLRVAGHLPPLDRR